MSVAKDQRIVERPFGPFERMLAMRYLGAKREHGGLAFISVVSVIGITLGVWALILTMSIMNGFRLELISKIVGFEPHVFIDTRGAPQSAVETLIEELRTRPGVENVEPMHEGTALASAFGRSDGIQVRGVRPEDLRKNELIAKSVSEGQRLRDTPGAEWPRTPVGQGSLDRFGDEGALSQDIVMGDAFAYALGVGVGDKITLTQANGARTVLGTAPRTKTYTVSAIYHVGNERFDRYVVFLPIESSKLLFGYDQGYPWVGIRLADANAADKFQQELEKEFPYRMQSWLTRNGTYVTALQVERNVMRLILFIVVVITALNIITGVLMLVKNKARDIAILRTIGATRAGVVRIFMMTGTVLGMTGVAIGVALGVLCAIYIAPIQHFIEDVIRIFNSGFEGLFPPSIYQLDSLPAKLEWGEVAWVGGMAFIVTLLMSVVPSMWAARLNPVEALRFE
jgi:lipoprotein-releasing system permease protein